MEDKTLYWTQADGTTIDVDLMTKEHLANVLKMLIRRFNNKKKEFDNWECNATEVDIY